MLRRHLEQNHSPDNERDAEEDDGVERLAERRRTAGSKSRIVRRSLLLPRSLPLRFREPIVSGGRG